MPYIYHSAASLDRIVFFKPKCLVITVLDLPMTLLDRISRKRPYLVLSFLRLYTASVRMHNAEARLRLGLATPMTFRTLARHLAQETKGF